MTTSPTFTIDQSGDSGKVTAQMRPDQQDFRVLAAAAMQTGVITGCAVTPSSGMTIAVSSGTILSNGTQVAYAGGTVAVPTAHATLPRKDVVYLTSAGVLTVAQGTAATVPVAPATIGSVAGAVALAHVYVPATDTTIGAEQITDKRMYLRSGALPSPATVGEQLMVNSSVVWQTVRPRVVYCTAYGITPTTGADMYAAIQNVFDTEDVFTTLVLVQANSGDSVYRTDQSITISKIGQYLISDTSGPAGVPESGDTPTNPTQWDTHGVVIVTNQAIYPVTFDVRNSALTGGDWRTGGIRNIGFGDYSTSHNTSPGAIKIVGGHHGEVTGCNATQFRNTAGSFIKYQPFVANAAQYWQINRNACDKMGFAAVASGTLRSQDIDAADNVFYGDNNTLNGPTGSRGWDLSNLASVRVKGGATQFWKVNHFLNEDSHQFYGCASEVPSNWTDSSVIQYQVGASARWTRIIGGDVINIAGSAGGIAIASGALETTVTGTKRNTTSSTSPVTSDAGTRTRISEKPIATTSAALTLDGRHEVVRCTGSGSYDLDLPPVARAAGRHYYMANDSSGTVNWDPNGSELINNSSASVAVTTGNRSHVFSDGSEWWTV